MSVNSKIIACNWKSYLGVGESISLAKALAVHSKKHKMRQRIIVAPSCIALYKVGQLLRGTQILLCAQNVNVESNGAYTGAMSFDSLRETGCKYVILGHSEVRSGKSLGIAETDRIIADKLRTCLKEGINPILCIGETLSEKEAGLTMKVLRRQLITDLGALHDMDSNKIDLMIAYEPVWAISSNGPSKSPDPAEINDIIIKLKKLLSSEFGHKIAPDVKFLYGGSVDNLNISGYLGQSSVDGVLIGGMSTNKSKIIGVLGK